MSFSSKVFSNDAMNPWKSANSSGVGLKMGQVVFDISPQAMPTATRIRSQVTLRRGVEPSILLHTECWSGSRAGCCISSSSYQPYVSKYSSPVVGYRQPDRDRSHFDEAFRFSIYFLLVHCNFLAISREKSALKTLQFVAEGIICPIRSSWLQGIEKELDMLYFLWCYF